MKLKGHKRRGDFQAITFTLSGISREELSLILSDAKEAMEDTLLMYEDTNRTDGVMYTETKNRLEKVRKMLDYIDHEDAAVVHLTPLEL